MDEEGVCEKKYIKNTVGGGVDLKYNKAEQRP